jgi:uncharacterized membrane protein YccC
MEKIPFAVRWRAWRAAVRARMPHREPLGLRYALRIFVGTLAAWELFRMFGDPYPIWATVSAVMVSEVELKATWDATKSRVGHTAVGCAVGLIFVAALGTGLWQMSVAAAVASLISFYFVHLGGNWRTAPVASVIVMATGVAQFSRAAGMHTALLRTAEVLGGSLVALAVSWAAQRLWVLSEDVAAQM